MNRYLLSFLPGTETLLCLLCDTCCKSIACICFCYEKSVGVFWPWTGTAWLVLMLPSHPCCSKGRWIHCPAHWWGEMAFAPLENWDGVCLLLAFGISATFIHKWAQGIQFVCLWVLSKHLGHVHNPWGRGEDQVRYRFTKGISHTKSDPWAFPPSLHKTSIHHWRACDVPPL